jgi:GNAT superfamily N-acetyltransferase
VSLEELMSHTPNYLVNAVLPSEHANTGIAMIQQQVTTYYLNYTGPELPIPAILAQANDPTRGLRFEEIRQPAPEQCQFLFSAVGTPWQWFSRLAWRYEQWCSHVASADVRVFVLYEHGAIAGYVELRRSDDADIEFKFFGLLPAFSGRGLGPVLMQAALAVAQQWQGELAPCTGRIWLHSCDLDHPAALRSYQRAGFEITEQVTAMESMPADYLQAVLSQDYHATRLAYWRAQFALRA